MKYGYRDGNGYPGLDADRLAEELEVIRSKHGVLTPEVTVEEARDNASPLHPHIFKLGTKAAAEEFYKNEARIMIRSIYVIVEENPDWRVPANINIRGDGAARGYFPVGDVMASADMRQEALRRVWETILRLRRLYSHMEQFASVWAEVDKVEKKVGRKKSA
jgi:hypothetical protein